MECSFFYYNNSPKSGINDTFVLHYAEKGLKWFIQYVSLLEMNFKIQNI